MAKSLAKAPRVAHDGDATLVLRAVEMRGDRSCAEAARLIGIRADELARIERGETSQVRWLTILKILRGYECSVEDLLEVEYEAPPPVEPAYVKPLQAIVDGRIARGLPARRWRAETQEDDGGWVPTDEQVLEHFGDDYERRRRTPFRPSVES